MTVDGKNKTQLITEFGPRSVGVITPESRCGPLGQKDKLHSCIRAVDSGDVRAAVIAKAEPGCLQRILKGESVGTLFMLRGGERIGKANQDDYIDPLYSGISRPSSRL
jgi:glutamate 5-kinase